MTTNLNSYTQKGAYLLWRKGKFPYPTIQPLSCMVLVEVDDVEETKECVIYARVSSNDQKEDLEGQAKRLKDFAISNGYIIKNIVTESRKKLLKVLRTDCNIIVENTDRLTRFGFEYIQEALSFSGRKIIVTSFCARIYGQRSAKNKANRILKELNENNKK